MSKLSSRFGRVEKGEAVRKKRAQLNRSSGRKPGKNAKPAIIKFYRANEKPYGAFSNLFRRSIEFEGAVYPTAEHAYQAGKAVRQSVRDWIQAAPTPALAAMAAHGLYTWDVVPNWAEIKFDRMRKVLKAKFSQHPDLATLLLSTGDSRLVEAGTVNNAVNRLWGEVDGKGQNMLGVMLMEVRKQLAAQPSPPADPTRTPNAKASPAREKPKKKSTLRK